MIIAKVNAFISLAIENSNIEKKEFFLLRKKKIAIVLSNTSTVIHINILVT